jgi:transglutaminase-like putative cysteine protease
MRSVVSAERRLTTVFPTGDPAGTVATCTAGLLEFSATLSWNRAEDLPQAPTLPALPATVRCSVVETDDPAMCRELGSALQTVLRSLTISAALSDAVLETRATRVARPASAPATTLQALALDLRDAGFEVRFTPSWTLVPEGAVGLGVLGAEQELESFLDAHPSWRAH